eukprot:TsM_000598800 transcript=TsM_000598800 gene=TsM_000598800
MLLHVFQIIHRHVNGCLAGDSHFCVIAINCLCVHCAWLSCSL